MKLDKEVKDFSEYNMEEKIDNIVATLSKVAEVMLWSTAPNKKDNFMYIVLRLGNHGTLHNEDLTNIYSVNPLSIETYTDGNNIFLEIQVKL